MSAPQELVSVLIVVVFCVSLSLCCLLLWFIRCRRIQQRSKNDQRQMEMNPSDMTHIPKKKSTPFTQRKVHEGAKETVKRQESLKRANSQEKPKLERVGSAPREDETIAQFETRVRDQFAPLQPIKEVGTPVRHKRLDTISVTAVSTDTLQRNDSKTNVFPGESLRTEEMDLNPGLTSPNSPINLETI